MKPRVRRRREVKGLVEQVSMEAAALPNEAMRRLLGPLAAAERELAAELTEVLAGMRGGTYRAQMLRRALVQVRGSLNAIERVHPEMVGAMHVAGRRAGQLANRHIIEEFAAFSTRFGGTLTPIPLLAANKVLEGTLLDRFDRQARRWTQQAKDEVRHQLAVGLLRGETHVELTRRLVGRAATGLSVADAAPQVAGALRRRMEAKAARVVRTELIHAYNQHSQDQISELAAEDSRILKRWDATIDGRTCADCRRLHGVAVRPTEDFPGGVYLPPLHPHCRCTTIVWREDWDRKKEDPATIELAGPPTGEE